MHTPVLTLSLWPITPSDKVVASKPHWSACVHFPQLRVPGTHDHKPHFRIPRIWTQVLTLVQQELFLNAPSSQPMKLSLSQFWRALTWNWKCNSVAEHIWAHFPAWAQPQHHKRERAPIPYQNETAECELSGILLHKTFYISYFVINPKTRLWRQHSSVSSEQTAEEGSSQTQGKGRAAKC